MYLLAKTRWTRCHKLFPETIVSAFHLLTYYFLNMVIFDNVSFGIESTTYIGSNSMYQAHVSWTPKNQFMFQWLLYTCILCSNDYGILECDIRGQKCYKFYRKILFYIFLDLFFFTNGPDSIEVLIKNVFPSNGSLAVFRNENLIV